ncbi:MAG: HAD family hydrolase [Pseudomonadales bacterium]
MSLAIFDLDETLISGDSDYLWGEFIVEKGIVDKAHHQEKNRHFYEQYKQGKLDVNAYLRFACSVLASISMDTLIELREEFIDTRIKPLVLPEAVKIVNSHKSSHDHVLIITSTIDFITRPIGELLGIVDLIAPIPEQQDGQYTGQITGIPSFGQGKVDCLMEWLDDKPYSTQGSYFYSDSINDLPLLEFVDHPRAVDPDDRLRQIATSRGWQIISFRG